MLIDCDYDYKLNYVQSRYDYKLNYVQSGYDYKLNYVQCLPLKGGQRLCRLPPVWNLRAVSLVPCHFFYSSVVRFGIKRVELVFYRE